MHIKKAIIPAAGYGTRSLPITKVIPKEMFPIKGKPAIHYIVEEAITAGIEEILIIVSRNKNMIIDYFDRSLELESFLEKSNKLHLLKKLSLPNIHIQYTRQPFARGLGDAISLGEPFVNNEPFAVLLPDDIFLGASLNELIDVYKETQKSVIGIQSVAESELHQYGVIAGKQLGTHLYQVTDLVEKPQTSPPSKLAVVGRYVLNPDIFTYLQKVKPGRGGEIQLTDALQLMVSDLDCYGRELNGKRYDIGKDIDYFELLKKVYNQNNH
ncbi:UTP--glucose-1-phosphate uridylyltransferase [Halalkalibacter krulwichiae]|uniref:UTP--glucose-1-phosphate uridylyltransferase n=1 Tax=Halalkalibacter krulwichiae TaxID=199441 RepID=A0A1X9MBE4_9BACI|nr:UTP--glucose-1-phosphate uridylyltransferase [Halalkalibacter krulwichiae]ARK30746.1 UTP--glucose-1-phosphate uridylyltransferase [Halalkalibacter krulwichiae]